LDGANGYFLWLADRARARFGMRTAEERIAGLQFLLPAVQRITDKLERVTVANEIAGYLGVDSGLVLEYFRKAAAERRDQPAPPPKDPTRPAEKILLNLLLASAEARAQILPVLEPLSAWQQFSTRRIFETVFSLEAAGERIAFDTVHARLDENQRELLEAAVMTGEAGEESYTIEQGEACLRALERGDTQARAAALKARIRECERSGDVAAALQLAAELSKLDRAKSS
jgi:hypothetical protein